LLAVKLKLGIAELEVFCSLHKLQKLWNRKHEFVEIANVESLEVRPVRGGNPTI